jgi:diguanylate cyclase
MTAPLRRDPLLWALGVLALVALATAVADTGGQVMGALLWPVLVVVCAGAAGAGWTIWRDPQAGVGERRVWGAAGVAAALFAVSDSTQLVLYVRDPGSLEAKLGGPVFAVGIMLGTLCVTGALLSVPLGLVTRQERVRFLLDAATVLVFAATLGCYFALAAGDAGQAGAGRVVSLLFGPAVYMVAVFSLVKLLLIPQKPFSPLAGALASFSATLEGAATGFRPMLVEAGHIPWQQGATVIAVIAFGAALRVQQLQIRTGGPASVRPRRRPYSLLPYAALTGTFALLIGVLAVSGWRPETWIVVTGAAAGAGLVVMRQLSAFAELRDSLAERDRLAGELKHLAYHDALTGLANRALFDLSLERGADCTVLLIDLDDFKPVNDEYGHAAGDAVLEAVALRLRAATGPDDVVARLGGDEFAVLTRGDGPALASRLADEIRLPITVLGQEVRVGASIGVATGRSGAALLRDADLAMYAEKSGRR